MKEPFGLEESSSRRWIDFVGFSILNQFSPAEDHGVTLLGDAGGGVFEYGAAVYNGTGGDELNDDKDVALRGVWHVVRDAERDQGLQLGLAATYGDADEDVAGEELETEARQPFLAFEPASELDGVRTRLGAELAWFAGRFALQTEALHVEQSMRSATAHEDVSFEGWYAQASWVLTGQDKTPHGIRARTPDQPLRAVQLAARISSLDLDDDLVADGLVAPGGDPDRVTSYDAGVNWWIDRHAVLRVHFLHTQYADAIALGGGTRDSEDALLGELQLQF
jgi:phosphate-selective porin